MKIEIILLYFSFMCFIWRDNTTLSEYTKIWIEGASKRWGRNRLTLPHPSVIKNEQVHQQINNELKNKEIVEPVAYRMFLFTFWFLLQLVSCITRIKGVTQPFVAHVFRFKKLIRYKTQAPMVFLFTRCVPPQDWQQILVRILKVEISYFLA